MPQGLAALGVRVRPRWVAVGLPRRLPVWELRGFQAGVETGVHRSGARAVHLVVVAQAETRGHALGVAVP